MPVTSRLDPRPGAESAGVEEVAMANQPRDNWNARQGRIDERRNGASWRRGRTLPQRGRSGSGNPEPFLASMNMSRFIGSTIGCLNRPEITVFNGFESIPGLSSLSFPGNSAPPRISRVMHGSKTLRERSGSSCCVLLQQLEHALRHRIGLRQHRRARLLQNLGFGQ